MSKLSEDAKRGAEALGKDAEEVAQRAAREVSPAARGLGGWFKRLIAKAPAKAVGACLIVAFALIALSECA